MRLSMSHRATAAALALGAMTLAPTLADARPGLRGGGATSISRPAGGGHMGANVNRSGNAIANRSGNRINNGNINVGNRTNININNDGHHDDWGHWDDHYHPVAAGVAFGTAAAVTAAAVGSRIYTLPPACSPYPYSGYSYYACGGVYYEPRYEGDRVVYVVVNKP